jgi:hypothetical protein
MPRNCIRAPRPAVLGALLASLLAVAVVQAAAAEPKSKQIETEAVFKSFDAAKKTITVTVIKPGQNVPGLDKLKKGKDAVFNVNDEGSVLTRTTVKLLTGQAATFTQLEAGKKVKIFWVPDEKKKGERFARSVSIFKPAEEAGEDAGDNLGSGDAGAEGDE